MSHPHDDEDDDSDVDEALIDALLDREAALEAGLVPPESPFASELDGLDQTSELLKAYWPSDLANREGPGGGVRLGPFFLHEQLGSGGFGVVYRARDTRMGRIVAIKALSGVGRAHLLRESLAGRLDHPNIIQIHEIGEEQGLSYIASAYCPGPSLDEWLQTRDSPVPARDAARITAALARGVAHAHSRGVLHRDLKPGNVLLWPEPSDGLDFTPRLSDFGLARLVEQFRDADDPLNVVKTVAFSALGSPPYMSPEQAEGNPESIDFATDVFGLGGLLYVLLTGRPPHLGETRVETLRLAREADIIPPSRFRPGLSRDLETIALKCLERVPARRYASAEAVAEDLQRYLDGMPIKARRTSLPVRVYLSSRRHPWRAASALLAAMLVVGGMAGLWLYTVKLRAANAITLRSLKDVSVREAQTKRAQRELEAANSIITRSLQNAILREADAALAQNRLENAQEILNQLPEREGEGETFSERWLRRTTFAEFTSFPVETRDAATTYFVGSRPALLGVDGRIELIEMEPTSGRTTRLATAGLRDWVPVNLLDLFKFGFAYHLGGGQLAIQESPVVDASPGVAVRLINGAGGVELARWPRTDGLQLGFPGPLAGGRVLAMVGRDPSWTQAAVRLLRPQSPTEPPFAEFRGARVVATVDSDRLLVQDHDRSLLVDAATGKVVRTLPGHHHFRDTPLYSTMNRKGTQRAGIAADGSLVIHDLERDDAPVLARLSAETVGTLTRLAFADESVVLLSKVGRDQGQDVIQTRLWHPSSGRMLTIPEGWPEIRTPNVSISKDGRRIAIAGGTPTVWVAPRLVDSSSGEIVATFPGRARGIHLLAFRDDSKALLIQPSASRTAIVWPFADQAARPPEQVAHSAEGWSLAWSPDGRVLASGADGDQDPSALRFWDAGSRRLLRASSDYLSTVASLAYSPDGRVVATGHLRRSENVLLWDAASGERLASLPGQAVAVRAVAWSPDGQTIAAAGQDGVVRLWDVPSKTLRAELPGHRDRVFGLCFRPDGGVLASASSDATVRLWDPNSGRSIATLPAGESLLGLAYRPDGRQLAAIGNQGSLFLWDGDPTDGARPSSSDSIEEGELRALAYSPEGRELAIAGQGRTIHLWDADLHQKILNLEGHQELIHALAFSPDGQTLASIDHAGVLRFWDSGARR